MRDPSFPLQLFSHNLIKATWSRDEAHDQSSRASQAHAYVPPCPSCSAVPVDVSLTTDQLQSPRLDRLRELVPHEERASTSVILDNAYDYIKALQVRSELLCHRESRNADTTAIHAS